MRLLVVEDESALQSQIQKLFADRHWTVDVAADGKEGLYLGREYAYDVAIVDLGLPLMSGLEVIQTWRKEENPLPILVLTARDHWQQKVEGLEAGADDYLTKPFHPEELLARVNALARRAAGKTNPVIKVESYALDTGAQVLTREGQVIALTSFEYRIVEYLMMHSARVISKTELTEHLYAQDHDRDSNVLEVLIARLRKKLDPEGDLLPLKTLRGQGYQFVGG